jgi:hypothetical protein
MMNQSMPAYHVGCCTRVTLCPGANTTVSGKAAEEQKEKERILSRSLRETAVPAK